MLPTLSAEIDEILSDSATYPFNGIISVRDKTGIIYEKVSGKKDIGSPDSSDLEPAHMFIVGSVTKQMLSAITLRLAESGLLDITFPIGTYLLEYQNEPWASKVTIEQLLSHTSGLVPSTGYKMHTYDFDLGAGGNYSYANQGYELIAKIITKVSNKTLGQLYSELFEHCGMSNSGIVDNKTIQQIRHTYPKIVNGHMYVPWIHSMALWLLKDWKIDDGYSKIHNPFFDGPQYLYPEAGNVITTVEDLHKWNNCLFHDLFKNKSTLDNFLRPRSIRTPCRIDNIGYGLGIMCPDKYLPEYYHTGWVYGYETTTVYYPEYEISVVIVENVSRIGTTQSPFTDFTTHDKLWFTIRNYIKNNLV